MQYDRILVGGGLQNGLTALALAQYQPELRVLLIEATATLGGNHTWSFHAGDIPEKQLPLITPLVIGHWPGYTIRFPGYAATLSSRYAAISSQQFAKVIGSVFTQQPGWDLCLNTRVRTVAANSIELENGTRFTAPVVIDGRGPGRLPTSGCGYQKFVGLEVELDRPWEDPLPTLMDACMVQDDGFRFVYVLPFSSTRVLFEDTYFADSPKLDEQRSQQRIQDYLNQHDHTIRQIYRQEEGILPMPWQAVDRPRSTPPFRGGYRGGWYHPATGYSFPLALRFALTVARSRPEQLSKNLRQALQPILPRQAYARLLNRLLFCLIEPTQRWKVFRRFYRVLSEPAVERFYALRATGMDMLRVLIGRPPSGLTRRGFWRALEMA